MKMSFANEREIDSFLKLLETIEIRNEEDEEEKTSLLSDMCRRGHITINIENVENLNIR